MVLTISDYIHGQESMGLVPQNIEELVPYESTLKKILSIIDSNVSEEARLTNPDGGCETVTKRWEAVLKESSLGENFQRLPVSRHGKSSHAVIEIDGLVFDPTFLQFFKKDNLSHEDRKSQILLGTRESIIHFFEKNRDKLSADQGKENPFGYASSKYN